MGRDYDTELRSTDKEKISGQTASRGHMKAVGAKLQCHTLPGALIPHPGSLVGSDSGRNGCLFGRPYGTATQAARDRIVTCARTGSQNQTDATDSSSNPISQLR